MPNSSLYPESGTRDPRLLEKPNTRDPAPTSLVRHGTRDTGTGTLKVRLKTRAPETNIWYLGPETWNTKGETRDPRPRTLISHGP